MHCPNHRRLFCFFLAALLVVGIVVGTGVLYQRHVRRMVTLSQREGICRELRFFGCQLQAWGAIRDQRVLPGPELTDAVAAVRSDEILKTRAEQICPRVLRGYDTWGQPFRYRIMAGGGAAELVSFGPNGHDDGGTGDDIVVRIHLDGDIFVVEVVNGH